MIERLMEAQLAHRPARHLLDVGPGYNHFSRVAARVTGATQLAYLDYDATILDWQRAECAKVGLAAQTFQLSLDVDDLQRIEGEYDLILCQEIFEHLPNAEAVLAALVEHLAPGGRFLVTVPTQRSERWLKRINPAYMRDEPYGHVREFDEAGLRALLHHAGLTPTVFIPTQPHYFVSHTWLFGSRMAIEGASGRVLSGGPRRAIWERLHRWSERLFTRTDPAWWGRLLPRNYFVIAERQDETAP